ncbi:hypothetical protein PN498_00170 [Oscillatoria sp. CS-180]|uniref:hypothetical protein n=1 Tax=Oscillatoria sp. CS-180 TaxID=3021720 RepID=UPI00233095F7|nr:hypothetical protein [Oscillatoria sp. CS-180]MDB9524385.1 hypothetical protein [Oscillatoria sp. CS-180]
MSFQFKRTESLSGKGFISVASLSWVVLKAAFAEEWVVKQFLSVLESRHIPHDDGGGPAAFAGEIPFPTAVGVFVPGYFPLRMYWDKKYFVDPTSLSEKRISSRQLREIKF